jgi:hypothetical protein
LKTLKKWEAKPKRRPALTDRQVRAKLQALQAEGTVDRATVTGIESALRQSRRVNAKYNKAHVHIGADPETHYVGRGEPEKINATAAADANADPETGRRIKAAIKAGEKVAAETAKADDKVGNTGSERAKQSEQLKAAEDGSRLTFSEDVAGRHNKVDSENVETSNSETLPFTGPRFRQTERMAAGGVQAARYRDSVYEKLAWPHFEHEHPAYAEAIEKIRHHAVEHLSEDAVRLADVYPNKAFAEWVASWSKKIRAPARPRRIAEAMESWEKWRDFFKSWRREHPDAQLPDDTVTRYVARPVDPVAAAVSTILHGETTAADRAARAAFDAYDRELHKPAPSDPLLADWVAAGMPIGHGDMRSKDPRERPLLRLLPEDDYLRKVDESARWMPRPIAQRMEATARWDWWASFRKYRPRSLLD